MLLMGSLNTESYKGVRDFYPPEMWVEEYIFDTWSYVAESFGYEKYGASVLEPAELYRAKSGQEIIEEQTYTFLDRGDREVTLRPEMTPTAARMIAARRQELSFPVRWYTIPNLFRYERPQRGRLREHWQLNCDLFGVPGEAADLEIITLADAIMQGFGAQSTAYTIHINHVQILENTCATLGIPKEKHNALRKLLDQKKKIDDFDAKLEDLIGISADTFDQKLNEVYEQSDVPSIIEKLNALGMPNVVVDHSIVRGMDYYTGLIFEIFDASPENNRSMFGGGRYDNLTELFGGEAVSGVGFGMGDVTIRDFLLTHDLMPERPAHSDLFLGTLTHDHIPYAQQLARELRDAGLRVVVNVTQKKVGDQVAYADKKRIPFVVIIGEDEVSTETFILKHLQSGKETSLTKDTIAEHIALPS